MERLYATVATLPILTGAARGFSTARCPIYATCRTTFTKIGIKLSWAAATGARDRKSTRLNSSHVRISYAVFCLKKKKHTSELHSRAHSVWLFLVEKKIWSPVKHKVTLLAPPATEKDDAPPNSLPQIISSAIEK